MIRAVMVTPSMALGGAERWVTSLIAATDPGRIQWTGVAVIGNGKPNTDLILELARNVPVHVVRCEDFDAAETRILAATTQMHDELLDAIVAASWQADVMVTWGSLGYRHFRQAIGPRAPVVVVSHAAHTPLDELDPAEKHVDPAIHLAAVSTAAIKPFQSDRNPPTTVLYNGVDAARLKTRIGRQQQRAHWGIGDTQHVIGYIGRLSTEKNPLALPLALKAMDAEWHGVCYGPVAPDMAEAVTSAQRQVGSRRLHLYQPVTALGDIYAGLDVLLLPSKSEAFSMTLLEGWYMGIPVVATPVGCIPELESRYGQLTYRIPVNARGDVIAAACRAAVAGSATIVGRARELVLQEFTAKAMADRWAAYLEQIVKRAGEKPGRRLIRLGGTLGL